MKKAFIFALLTVFATAFAASEGENSFYAKCGSCHGTALSLNSVKNEQQWTETIKRMKKHGLNISSSETKSVANFLSRRQK